MNNNYLEKYEPSDSGSDNVIEELIFKTYLEIFNENKDEKNPDNRIPTTSQMFQKADYDFDIGCYDIIYNASKKELTHENIMILLEKKGCVYRWGASICGDAQITMFNEDELIGDDEGWYLNAPTT